VSGRRRREYHRSWPAGGRRRWRSALSWLSIVAILSLLFMPVHDGLAGGGDGGAGFGQPCSATGYGVLDRPHPTGNGPTGNGPAGHGSHDACPFCVAHAGYSPPPPQPPDLRMAETPLSGLTWPVAEPWSATRPFLIRPQPRAPPAPGLRLSPTPGGSDARAATSHGFYGLCPA
jgi:hypothetical protein